MISRKLVGGLVFSSAFLLSTVSLPSYAADSKSLDELLSFVKQGQAKENKKNKQREARFRAEKSKQASLLSTAKKTRDKEEKRSAALEKTFEANEVKLTEKQKQLKERLGSLTELFGHLTSAAGDARSNLNNSLVSAQYGGRAEFIDGLIATMSGSENLPSIEEIERLWYELQREMTESGRVVSFDTEVTRPNGDKVTQQVVRVGTFNIVSEEGKYLQFVPETGSLEELARQPKAPYPGWAADLASATDGMVPFGADPTGPKGGTYLSALIDSPTIAERWHQGGLVGYIISGVGVFAALLALWRFIVLMGMGAKVKSQLKSDKANTNNPLGRVLAVHEQNPSMDSETLELKLSEAILKETPKIESGLNLLKIISAVAPLMGLLGTVTGMIITFQAITIFGAGDPKAMAGGISGALVTTVLGLVVAIPTVLMHTVVNGRAKKVLHILEEQSTGIIAEHTESGLGK